MGALSYDPIYMIKPINHTYARIKSTLLCDLPPPHDSDTLKQNIVNYMQVQYSIIILFPSKHREKLKHQACAHQHFSPTTQQTHHKGDACDWQRKNYIKLIVHFTLLGRT